MRDAVWTGLQYNPVAPYLETAIFTSGLRNQWNKFIQSTTDIIYTEQKLEPATLISSYYLHMKEKSYACIYCRDFVR